MKYCVVIIDGASGWPLPERGGKTCLELARIPNLDRMAGEGTLGMVRTVPEGMEPSSACACMSIMGYDPRVYYRGRSGIEAASMGITVEDDEVTFRCNLVAVQDGRMRDYSAGHIRDSEAHALLDALEQSLGDESVTFYKGVGYRHICKIKGQRDTLQATCTPPHDIPDKPIVEFLPSGPGSEILRDLMARSVDVLRDHPVNRARESRGELPATMLWLFWGSGKLPAMPRFKELYGLDAAMTSGVGLLKGMALMVGVDNLDIPGVTDGMDNDYAAQANGALEALDSHALVFIHVEAPDEAGHAGLIDDKIEAIERVDSEVVGRLLSGGGSELRILAMPDHPTPIGARTHVAEAVPFVLRGPGVRATGAKEFCEAEARGTGFLIEEGYNIMRELIKG